VRGEDNVSNESPYTTGQDATLYHSGIERVFLPILVAPDPNWGFETGDFTSWQHDGQLAQSVSTAMPHSGNYSARLGRPDYECDDVPEGSAWLRRNVTVPSSGSPTLSFWYLMVSQDKTSTEKLDWYDLFEVRINGSRVFADANFTIEPDDETCPITYNSGWKPEVVPLDAYKEGERIEITFYNHNRAPPDHGAKWYNTYTYVDDISVQ
jgi:hypothetical protein